MEKKGNYYSILGLYVDNGKQHGNYYGIWRLYGDRGTEEHAAGAGRRHI